MASTDPKWIEKIYEKDTGEDFLGLRSVQASITGYLLPGIITITPRARYYAFYSWLLVEYGEKHPDGWTLAKFIKRREQIFALAILLYQYSLDSRRRVLGLTGTDKLRAHLIEFGETDKIPITVDDYVRAAYGGYGAYTGVMRALRITRISEDNDRIDIPPKGQELAKGFAKSILGTRYYRDRDKYDPALKISRDVLLEYGSKCHLDMLAVMPDRTPTIEALFSFNSEKMLPHPDAPVSTSGNMRGTLGLILDILSQADRPIRDSEFRESVMYGRCEDFSQYKPHNKMVPILAHWNMFQIREFYVYALYALWRYFLHWLRVEGPQTLEGFKEHLNDTIILYDIAEKSGVDIIKNPIGDWQLTQLLGILLDQANIGEGELDTRCKEFARQSKSPLNEYNLFLLLENTGLDQPSVYVGAAVFLISSLYLRLRGLKLLDQSNAWTWSETGGARRRSMALFVFHTSSKLDTNQTVLEMLHWLYRDYIIAQHTITSLEKWRQRKVSTFHFNYSDGFFEWVRNGRTGFSASRFRQAYDMLFDMGLFEIDKKSVPKLTALGNQLLKRVLENIDD